MNNTDMDSESIQQQMHRQKVQLEQQAAFAAERQQFDASRAAAEQDFVVKKQAAEQEIAAKQDELAAKSAAAPPMSHPTHMGSFVDLPKFSLRGPEPCEAELHVQRLITWASLPGAIWSALMCWHSCLRSRAWTAPRSTL